MSSTSTPNSCSSSGQPQVERLFFALWPTDDVRQTIKRHCKSLLRHTGGRPVAEENLHITLAFLGSVDAVQHACVEEVATAIQLPSFELILDQIGYWARPRVLWLGAREIPEPLQLLVNTLNKGCGDCGLSLDKRPFKAHLTLKRKVHQAPPTEEVKPVLWPVERFVLVKSNTLPQGVQYEVVREWLLQANS